MDRIAVRVSNEAIFAKFLSLTDKEYVDVFFSKNQAFAVNNSSEVFGYLPLACAGCSQESLISCRVSRTDLARLVSEGFLVFSIADGWVSIEFIDSENNKLYTLKLRNQQVHSEEYQDKLLLLSHVTKDMFFDADCLRPMCKLMKTYKAVLTIENGVISAPLPMRGKIFQEADTGIAFAYTAEKLDMLLSISGRIFSAENYVGASAQGISILVTKCRGLDNSEYALFKEAKSAFVCTLDLQRLRSVIAKYDRDDGVITINVQKQHAILQKGRAQIIVPVRVSDVQRSAKCDLETIDIPTDALKRVFSKLSNCVFRFSQKKYAMLFEAEGIEFYL